MDLSVIIVCYKGYERLGTCLEALASFSLQLLSMEVIVVNNNPGDALIVETEKRFAGFRFIHNNVNGGYSNGCNLGSSAAAGEYFLILNPDTVAEEKAVVRLLEEARANPAFHIISCRQLKDNGKESRAYGKFPWRSSKKPSAKDPEIILPDWVSGSVMLMHRDRFTGLEGFDEDFWMYYEDVDLCRRARDSGGEIAFFNNIQIVHNHGASSRFDSGTAARSKCEVQISRHLYIHKHERGIRRTLIQTIITTDNIVTGLLTGAAGLMLFFIPGVFLRSLLLANLLRYYAGALAGRSWLSPNSVNYKK